MNSIAKYLGVFLYYSRNKRLTSRLDRSLLCKKINDGLVSDCLREQAKRALYPNIIIHIPIKRTEEVKGKTNNNQYKRLKQQTKKPTNISAIRRKLRDELRNHYLFMLFFNKKIVLPTPISKINQLIRIDDKKSKPTAFWLAFSFLC